MEELILKLLKFGAVGFSGLFIDFGITYITKEKLKWHKYLANSLGFIFAASNNFVWNRLWTFQSHDPKVLMQYSQFIGVSLIGLILNNFIIYIFNDRLKVNFYISKVIAVGFVTVWNFFVNYYFTFSTNI
ncbi:GtrA family protein [Persicobacter psychrovividus]|uniref:Dolichyl-phosphate beta-D-mannosyltransferase n=1 Tax=Persicobacter psychrovividus TaxID=387638 RepID=A0ABN6L7R0_9BACT|nr:dolichyl-phosphate beta-D-mannosyltransferase [Persicobacter psychrovividus]